MTKDDVIEVFTKEYLVFADAVLKVEKNKRNLASGSGFLSRIFASPFDSGYLAKNENVFRLAEKLFSYDVKGLKCRYERSVGMNLMLWRLTNNDEELIVGENPEEAIRRLLYPIIFLTNFGYNLDVNLDDEEAELIIKSYARCWQLDIWEYTVVVPIYNLKYLNDETSKIGNFLVMKGENATHIPSSILKKSQTFLVWEDFPDQGEIGCIEKELEKVVTYLRLFLPNKNLLPYGIGADQVYFVPSLPRMEMGYTPHAVREYLRVVPINTELDVINTLLTEDIVEEINNLHLDQLDIFSQLASTFRRFNHAFERESDEDKVTDLIIALESCLLSPSEKGEIGYKQSLRAATLLRKKQQPKRTRGIIKTAYNIRSMISHDGENFQGKKIKKELRKFFGENKPQNYSDCGFISVLSETTRKIIIEIIDIIRGKSAELNIDINKKISLEIIEDKIEEEIDRLLEA